VIHSLIASLNDEENAVRSSVSAALGLHCHSLCISLLNLTDDDIACLYEYHLFLYSCSHVLSLQVLAGRLCFYTEQGVLYSEPIGSDKEEAMLSAFGAAQHKAGLQP